MNTPRVMLATLCLNEMQWLPKLYQQHKEWPGLVGWAFVEGADHIYAMSNPDLVTKDGLSVDGTSDFLHDLKGQDSNVRYVRHGFGRHVKADQGKCGMRNRYLEIADKLKPDVVIVLDADEFYPYRNQYEINDYFQGYPDADCLVFRHREIWHPPFYQESAVSIFAQEVVGGFWSIPYCRVWKFYAGMRYHRNHNTPEVGGVYLDGRNVRFDSTEGAPYLVHTGFASKLANRQAKHRYYQSRGEGRTDHRAWYVQSREAWETWKPGKTLPKGATVRAYDGIIPECFR